MKPSQPTNDLACPWANGGDKTIIPEAEASAPGRATMEEGFPYVTQLPINSGGVAPNRTDFNGILYLLSALNFWQQSGGQASWKSTLSYVSPAIVYHNSNYWVAVAESGPDTSAGAVTPGTNDAYWQELLAWLAANSSNIGLVGPGNTVKLTGDTTGTGTFDANGDVSVATTTAVATALRNARNISLTGDATGTGNYDFDGTRDVSIATSVSKADAWRSNMTLSLGNDASGSVSFNGSTTPVTLNATVNTATALRNARNISLTGDASGSLNYNFDGTRDVSLSATVSKADAWRSNMTLSLGNDASGSVSFNGSSSATLNATVNTATQLRTARDIILSGDVTGSISGTKFNGAGDVTITTKLASSSSSSMEGRNMIPSSSSLTSKANGTTWSAGSDGWCLAMWGHGHHCTLTVHGKSIYLCDGDAEVSICYVPLKSGQSYKMALSDGQYDGIPCIYWLPADATS